MITVPLQLDRLDDVGPVISALREQASRLRAQADMLDRQVEQVTSAAQQEIKRLSSPPPPVTVDVAGRITTGEAPDRKTGGVPMSDDQVDNAIIQAVGPQPGGTQPHVTAPQPPAAAQQQRVATQPAQPAAPAPSQAGVPDHVEVIPWNGA